MLAWDICERFIRLIGVSNDGKYFDENETPGSVSFSELFNLICGNLLTTISMAVTLVYKQQITKIGLNNLAVYFLCNTL